MSKTGGVSLTFIVFAFLFNHSASLPAEPEYLGGSGLGLGPFPVGMDAQGRYRRPVIPQFNQFPFPEGEAKRITGWLDRLAEKTGTGLPLSFDVPEELREEVWLKTSDSKQRVILNEGLIVYDGALAQILWGIQRDFKRTDRVTEVLWKGDLGQLKDLRAYFNPDSRRDHPFIYGQNPFDVSAGKGRRGFIFKIINAAGNYHLRDPLNHHALIWDQWLPVAGENAWAGVIAPLQIYYQKYGTTLYPEAIELKLAEEIARAALLLQADNGGIRMAPKGSWHPKGSDWYYQEQSVENSLSWYAAFRMLYRITGDRRYQRAILMLEQFFKTAFDQESSVFVQGKHFDGSGWINAAPFATDVQTWGIMVLGAERIDSWFGEGTCYRMLQACKNEAGVFDPKRKKQLLGVDFTNYRKIRRDPMVSIEWSAGAIFAFLGAGEYYLTKNPEYFRSLMQDLYSMHVYLNTLAVGKPGAVAYPYATGSGNVITRATGHGWYAPPEEVLSTASSVWMAFLELGFNPFELGG